MPLQAPEGEAAMRHETAMPMDSRHWTLNPKLDKRMAQTAFVVELEFETTARPSTNHPTYLSLNRKEQSLRGKSGQRKELRPTERI